MKYRIDKYGNLHKWVGGKWKETICKFKQIPCGDHCPDFGEVNTMKSTFEGIPLSTRYSLDVCDSKILTTDDFQDERGKDADD